MEALSGADNTAHVTIDFANKALRRNRSECSHLLQQQRNDVQFDNSGCDSAHRPSAHDHRESTGRTRFRGNFKH
jgi:hypothetical protein